MFSYKELHLYSEQQSGDTILYLKSLLTSALSTVPPYLDLVDYSGRVLRNNKRRSIPGNLAPILKKMNTDTWIDELKSFRSAGYSAVGTIDQLKNLYKKVAKSFALGHRLKPALE